MTMYLSDGTDFEECNGTSMVQLVNQQVTASGTCDFQKALSRLGTVTLSVTGALDEKGNITGSFKTDFGLSGSLGASSYSSAKGFSIEALGGGVVVGNDTWNYEAGLYAY